jgi:TPR repeat protein
MIEDDEFSWDTCNPETEDLFSEAIDGMDSSDDTEIGVAIGKMKKAAVRGKNEAACILGDLYMTGYFRNAEVEVSYPEAYRFYKMAADRNSPAGIAGLGELYYSGLGVEQSYSKAAELIEKSCGYDAHAAQRLADMYYDGIGVEQSYSKALEFLLEIEDEDEDTGVDYRIGCMYLEGLGAERSEEKARKYLEVSAGFGHEEAVRKLHETFDSE